MDDERIGIAILGSTGSVGRQTLEVIESLSGRFRVVALAARTVSERFLAQVARFTPEVAAVSEWPTSECAAVEVPAGLSIATGMTGLVTASTHPLADIVVVASSGHAGIVPTIRALELGKTIALANKETLICAGEIIIPLAAAHGAAIRPVDSEHSAIWQALDNVPINQVRRIILTASGGPFRTTPRDVLSKVAAADALVHPTWSMGDKITIDSATLMNKGLELIEAHWLFALPYDQIDVLVHPESIIHSLVEFVDGGQIAQLGLPDMRLPIQYALTYPERVHQSGRRLDLAEIGTLHFEFPDKDRFPALELARQAGIAKQTYPTVLSAADDEAVTAFLAGDLRLPDITNVVASVIELHEPMEVSLEAIREADFWARNMAKNSIATLRLRR